MRSSKRGRTAARIVLILTIAAAVALAVAGGGAAFADTVWAVGQSAGSVAVQVGQ